MDRIAVSGLLRDGARLRELHRKQRAVESRPEGLRIRHARRLDDVLEVICSQCVPLDAYAAVMSRSITMR